MSKVRLIMMSVLAVFAAGAVASTSASAHNGHQFLVNGAGITSTLNVLSNGGLFLLAAGTLSIHFKKATGVGTVSPNGLDFATEIHFLECSTGATNCDVHSIVGGASSPEGLIVVTNIETELIETENPATKKQVLADLFKQKTVAGTKEFVTLGFTALAAEACKEYPETKVKGSVAAKVNNATEELEFPKPELAASSLTAFGKAATLTGNATQMLTNGGALTAD